jgi:protein SCO1/2
MRRQPPTPRRPRQALLLGLAALLALPACERRPEELLELGTLPPFAFHTEQGQPLSDATLRGQPWVANFLFTSCPTACPPLARATASLQGRIAAWRPAGGPRIVSFTVDPVTDTPEVLRTFARRYGADPKIWSFARADYAATEALVTGGFLQPLLRSDRQPDAPLAAVADRPTPFDTAHSLRFVLVDRQGRMRALYGREEADLDRLDRALRWLHDHPRER